MNPRFLSPLQRYLLQGSNTRLQQHQVRRISDHVIRINDGTFYRDFPDPTKPPVSNAALFPNLSFSLDAAISKRNAPPSWAVLSSSSLTRTTFLRILGGQHICLPPGARTYPHLTAAGKSPQQAIQYVGFDAERGSSVGGSDVRGSYLSARYESRREVTDFSVRDYLTGNTELNALEEKPSDATLQALNAIVEQLNLGNLLDMPVSNLSNGQTRRARIAKALMESPEVLLLDGPFMGLDPRTRATMTQVLGQIVRSGSTRVVLSLNPDEACPEWISHLLVAKQDMTTSPETAYQSMLTTRNASGEKLSISKDGYTTSNTTQSLGEPIIEMRGVQVSYGANTVLGDWSQNIDGHARPGLWWTLRRGQRCGIFGPNGSGKTTMLSLITSDHPQAYSLPIEIFGRSRLPEPGRPGISLFDLQRRMGHSSPEVHSFFPRQLSVRAALESAWADAPLARPTLTGEANRRLRFGGLPFGAQRLTLFLRALLASPDLVILDEALSGVDEAARAKAFLFLAHGERFSALDPATGSLRPSVVAEIQEHNGGVCFAGLDDRQALLVISHARADVPGCVREWICLPEPGERRAPRTGRLTEPLEIEPKGWEEIWGQRDE
ncbi:ABC transporter domain-containing protein [Dissoconium aciculare CBS 342.82]|uniref:ABC transporter domain-containing protein n=1 Tax=Dissoconium aciculare CBS 342.82 TaxID=1314786 RepID=A0A6J3M9F0_9PEZI|nr:ABC transporter domain-containing protein [Dissoconium aciculare CBS 342.82]KAF1824483.1 ABC transporter domain-containing protein [Dissoconium aciculare CBS 342.82]